jgi:uncharacterized protein (TIGR04255 family)
MTDNYPNLINAPIEEAIVGFFFKKKSDSDFKPFNSNLTKEFPEQTPSIMRKIEVQYNVEEDAVEKTSSEHPGWTLRNDDDKIIMNIDDKSLRVHKLKSYKNWICLYKSLELVKENYDDLFEYIDNPFIKYINKFEVDIIKWKDYLKIYPHLEDQNQYCQNLPELSIYESDTRFTLSSINAEEVAKIYIQLRPHSNSSLMVTIDIEITSTETKILPSNSLKLEKIYDNLRNIKNQIFFSNILKTEELFGHE